MHVINRLSVNLYLKGVVITELSTRVRAIDQSKMLKQAGVVHRDITILIVLYSSLYAYMIVHCSSLFQHLFIKLLLSLF